MKYWVGNLTSENLSEEGIRQIWADGHDRALVYLKEAGYSQKESELNSSIDILNPFGLADNSSLMPDECIDEPDEHLIDLANIIDCEQVSNEQCLSDAVSNDKHNSKIQIDEKVNYKSNVVSHMIHSNSKLSSKRNTRFFGLSDDCFSVNDVDNLQFTNPEEQVLISDVLVTILQHKINVQFFIALVSIDKMVYQNNNVNSIRVELLKEAKFICTILSLNNIEDDNIIWLGKYGEQIRDIEGSLCCQLQNSVSFYEGNALLKFPKSEIVAIREYLEIQIDNQTELKIPKASRLYDSQIELQAFLKFRDNMKDVIRDDKLKCRICNESHSRSRMRVHIGKHLLSGRIKKNSNVCGYCGIIGCSIEFKQGSVKSIMKPKSNCRYFYEFNLKSVAKKSLSENAPCSNRPVNCKNCFNVFWSYNLEQHYLESHQSLDVNIIEIEVLPTLMECKKVLASQF